MWFLSFYRFFVAIFAALLFYFFLLPSIWAALATGVVSRILWGISESIYRRMRVKRLINKHCAPFKQYCGPYGIRIANKAEQEWAVKQSLAEVFVPGKKELQKNVETLEVLNTLFNAGMRPQGDDFLIHDLKLKYGKYRLETDL